MRARRDVNRLLRVHWRRGIFRREAGGPFLRRTVLCFATHAGRAAHGYADGREGGLFLYYSRGRGFTGFGAENRWIMEQVAAGDDLVAFSDEGLPRGDTRCLGLLDARAFRWPVPTGGGEPAVVFELAPRDPAAFAALALSEAAPLPGGWARHPVA